MNRGLRNDYDTTGLPHYMPSYMNGLNRGVVYILVAEDLNLVKIGSTNRWKATPTGVYLDAEARIKEVQQSCIVPTRLAAKVLPCHFGTESQHHRYFEQLRYRKDREWFWYVDSLRKYVEELESWSKAWDLYMTDCERYRILCKADPEGEREGRITEPKSPKAPWLDFSSACPKPQSLPIGWKTIN